MKIGFRRYIVGMFFLAAAMISSCVKNDIPYPYIELYITNIEGDGFSLRRIVNSERTVYLTLDETTDIESVNITSVDYSEEAKISKDIVGEFDLTNPLKTTLYLYQSYEWQIVAEQSIDYAFNVSGQIGAERIDRDLLTIDVDVNENTIDLQNVTINDLKLGGEGVTTYSPTIEELMQRDYSGVVRVDATSHNRTTKWSIRLHPVTPTVELTADAWGRVAWLSATGDTTNPESCYFEYREVGGTWVKVESDIVSSGIFEACVTGLTPESDYEFIAYAESVASSVSEQTTESTPQLPNGGFEEWQTIGKIIFPYLTEEYWGTGNTGSTTVGTTNVTESDDAEIAPNTTGSYSALLSSKDIVTVLATGNIFTGSFSNTNGTYGVIRMGRPFTQRPLRLEGCAKYICGEVTHTNTMWGDPKIAKGESDQGMIYIALGTWTKEKYGYDGGGTLRGTDISPVAADTSAERTFFDNEAIDIIAYGEKIFTSDEDWSNFSIELDYRDLTDSNGNIVTPAHSRVPTHIIITAVSSRYGDYYTGSKYSQMWLDDFELIYE
ncbi:MAG: PCMD domain-containing protein [Rikenellaceae bacterium]